MPLCVHNIECDPAEPWRPGTCARCWRGARDEARRQRPRPPRACRHLGPATGERRPLLSCAADPPRTAGLRACALHGVCTETEVGRGRPMCCRFCPDRRPADPPPPAVVARFDEHNLAPGVHGRRFNSSLIADRGGYLLAFRTWWAGSEVGLARLDRDLQPTGEVALLPLRHKACGWGREDPRLFRYRGQLHVAFTGVTGRYGPTHVLYARLSDTFAVEAVYAPAFADRQPWEKNWAFFPGVDGDLYAVYSVAPHRILRVRGDRCELAYETPTPARWSGGHLRGGASPVWYAGTWWHMFHGRLGPDAGPTYSVGLYTFDDRPPYRVRAMTPDPLLTADWATTNGNYAAVVFPCGAVREADSWLVSMGVHDQWTDVVRFDAAAAEDALAPVG